MPVIGYLPSGRHVPSNPFAVAFREGLRETGYIEGQNVAFEFRPGRASVVVGYRHQSAFEVAPQLDLDLVSRRSM
jgi:hypothetical protein